MADKGSHLSELRPFLALNLHVNQKPAEKNWTLRACVVSRFSSLIIEYLWASIWQVKSSSECLISKVALFMMTRRNLFYCGYFLILQNKSASCDWYDDNDNLLFTWIYVSRVSMSELQSSPWGSEAISIALGENYYKCAWDLRPFITKKKCWEGFQTDLLRKMIHIFSKVSKRFMPFN